LMKVERRNSNSFSNPKQVAGRSAGTIGTTGHKPRRE
jgi:hypothetical protein